MISSKMRIGMLAALAMQHMWQASDIKFTTDGNQYPASSKAKGHAARQKRQSKKRKAK